MKRAQTFNNDYVSPPKKQKMDKNTREQVRNENILCAIISLMRELDKSGLEFIKKDCEKRISQFD
jgi:hypothetical protein